MKAVIQHEFGGSHILQLAEVETPTITEEEVLLKTAYTSVNYADIKSRRGNKGKGKFPLTLGLDATGTVVEAGTSSGFSEGDRVIAFPKGGSYAEYVKAHKQLTFRIPESLSFEQAAAMPTVSILSYILLHDIGQVKKSDTIVVHSGAGGVGSMLIQLAKLAGVETVMATVGNLSKEDYVKRMGADHVCTYDTFSEEVLQLTNGKGANAVFDSVAGEVTTASLDCLGLYGTLVQFGNSSGSAGHFKTSDVHSSCRNVKGFSLGTTRKHRPDMLAPAAERVIELFAAGKVTLPIAKVFDLSDAKQAHDLIESRAYEGKVLIKA
ncbi:zinc-binding dehydrogenase [Rossellomorea vietnamensis]|uniref:Zinc-binding dehydrogenase n=1 Tax=Rossellomorea vietnamensis TaxID=218284 RepID=A0ACD4C5F5_9BACI|nr:zinc-binding dehydrogenase [Rossellomorea vietnamensis]UXH43889.1 zinc-binding dehydrogenase [Rossellomorea vietnamensis]